MDDPTVASSSVRMKESAAGGLRRRKWADAPLIA